MKRRQATREDRLTEEDIHSMITSLGSIPDVLADADAQDKADVYRNLSLKLTYNPAKQLVRAEAQLDPHKLGL